MHGLRMIRPNPLRSCSRGCFLACVLFLVPLVANAPTLAGERSFAWAYEAHVMPRGGREYEQWITWKTDKGSDPTFDRLDLRHEIEFGLTDRLQAGIYFADWRYQDGALVVDDGAEFHDTAVEFIYQLADPTLDPIGSALYGEVKVGPEFFELEGKLILQKNFPGWKAVWNGTIEAEWEGDGLGEDKGAFEQVLGLSWQLAPDLSVGVELMHEIEFDDWSETADDVVYLGPNVTVRTNDWWCIIAPLLQVTDVISEPDFQVRALLGFDF